VSFVPTLRHSCLWASVKHESRCNKNVNVIQDTNLSGISILLGEFASTFLFRIDWSQVCAAFKTNRKGTASCLGCPIFSQEPNPTTSQRTPIRSLLPSRKLQCSSKIIVLQAFIYDDTLMTFFGHGISGVFLVQNQLCAEFRPSFHYFKLVDGCSGIP